MVGPLMKPLPVIICVIVGLVVLGQLSHAFVGPTAAGPAAASAQPQDATAPQTVPCCTASIGGLDYTVGAIKRTKSFGDGSDSDDTAAGEFLIIEVSVHNTGNTAADVSDSNFHLTNAAGQTFDVADRAGFDLKGEWELATLNPGLSKNGNLIFDVPADTEPAKYNLQVFGNGSSDYELITLE